MLVVADSWLSERERHMGLARLWVQYPGCIVLDVQIPSIIDRNMHNIITVLLGS